MAGIDECLRQGADIIVNTDADNQYSAQDIETIIRPILTGNADVVIGERPIDHTEHFSMLKKKLQHIGSWVVRKASDTTIPDAPSGFRAYSRSAAMSLNIINEYTYTLEQIVQAGRNKTAIVSVPVHTNEELRPSRLFSSMFGYIKKSMITIVRAYLMYKPLRFFTTIALFPMTAGLMLGFRYLWFFFQGNGNGHIQSLLLATMLILLGTMIGIVGLQADVISANRKILEDLLSRVRKIDYEQDRINNRSKDTEDISL